MVKVVNEISQTTPQFVNLRFERKFIFENILLEDLIDTVVLTNRYCFEEIYERRTVNNIYFDDNNRSFYKQNVSGDGNREKYRLRWYNDSFSTIKAPTIEIKKKMGEVGDKVSFKMKDFEANLDLLDADSILMRIREALKDQNNIALRSKFQNLTPTLYNTYERRYFLSFCEKFRITLDFNMNFFNPYLGRDFCSTNFMQQDIVLELKYNREHDDESRMLSQQISSRLSKNSKYVRGIDLIHP